MADVRAPVLVGPSDGKVASFTAKVPRARSAAPTRYDLDREQLAALLPGEASYRIDQVWRGLYRDLTTPSTLTTLSQSLRRSLAEEPALRSALDPVTESVTDDGETVKWLFALPDGRRIETVLMHYADRSTVCVSSQAGCAMACGFCATGQGGFERHLTAGEIVEQVVWAERRSRLDGRRVGNVVFMGMGEPLANYDRLWAAIRRVHDDLGIGSRHITVSTVGVVPGIRRLANEALPVGLAVSLHAATDAKRDALVPLNRRYPLEALLSACEEWTAATGRRLSFEWALIEGVNDRADDVVELAAITRRLRAHVNVIPLNPTPGYLVKGSSADAVAAFAEGLRAREVNVTIRATRGAEIDAACGQLAQRVPIKLEVRPRRGSHADPAPAPD